MGTGGDEERVRIVRKMFLSEAHLVGMLQHPHILPTPGSAVAGRRSRGRSPGLAEPDPEALSGGPPEAEGWG